MLADRESTMDAVTDGLPASFSWPGTEADHVGGCMGPGENNAAIPTPTQISPTLNASQTIARVAELRGSRAEDW